MASTAPKEPAGRRPRPDIVHSSLYLPAPVYEYVFRCNTESMGVDPDCGYKFPIGPSFEP